MSEEKPTDGSLDNPSNCLSPERQIKRPRTDTSSPIEINTKSSTDEAVRPLPGFVAGILHNYSVVILFY